jgi:magnesium transporter
MPQGVQLKPEPLGVSLTDELYQNIVAELKEGNALNLEKLVAPLHSSDIADLLERLTPDERQIVFSCLHVDKHPEVLVELSAGVQESMLAKLPTQDVANAIEQMESDDTVDVLQHLDFDKAAVEEILDSITEEEHELLTWPEDCAGGLMQVEFLTLPKSWTVEKVQGYFREKADDIPDRIRNIFVTNKFGVLLGVVSLSRLMHQPLDKTLAQTMRTDPVTILPETEVSDVVSIFEKYDLQSCAVVDETGAILGRITVDDVLDAVLADRDKSMMRSAGLEEGEDLFAPVIQTTRRRFPWLLVNLFTAISASLVIALFAEQIEQLVALAVLMPIVASMGGNAGSQTLTVTVRGLAMKQITLQNMFRLLKKELFVGGFNGLLLAILVGLGTVIIYGDWMLGAIICGATVANHIFAAIAGNVIPLILEKTGKDPAISAGVLVTTVTDIGGFFTFLGLAALFLL